VSSKFATYELEEEAKAQGYSFVAGVDEVGRGCEHPGAEVLTQMGWKFYYDLTLDDKILSYDFNGNIVWQSINSIVEKDFCGNLIELKNRSVHILVTPDHYFDVLRRRFKRDKLDGNKLKIIGYVFNKRKCVTDLSANDFIPCGGCWVGEDKKYFVLPAVKKEKHDYSGKNYNKKKIPMDVWVAFMGIFLSGGYTSYRKGGSYVIGIRQVKKENYKKIKNLLKKLPFSVFEEEDNTRLVIRNKQLYMYLSQFGKCYTKFIPDDLKALSPPLLNILIDWLIIGDGSCYKSKNRKEVCMYYTVSKKLKDDFEEILLKAGWTYKTVVREPKDRYICGRLIKKENCVPCYETRLRRNNKVTVKYLHKTKINYSGKVFCLKLPKYHNFYVRRSGTGYFTGNSGSGPVTAAAVIIPEHYLQKLMGRVKDSKKLSERKREALYEEITQNCEYGIGKIDNNVIDEINILEATKLAMRDALLCLKNVDYALIDGTVKLHDLWVPQQQVIRGDSKSISIAAASIIAKVIRDEEMRTLHWVFPEYNFFKNKGYLTLEHRKAIKLYGSCKYHRESFRLI